MTPQEFKSTVKHRLIDLDMSQSELIAQVRERTGLYLDSSYMNRIYKGKNHPEKIMTAIAEILDLPKE